MALKRVLWNVTTKEARVVASGAAVPGGFVDIGSFEHEVKAQDKQGVPDSHVIYHHVQELLYHKGVEGMDYVKITSA